MFYAFLFVIALTSISLGDAYSKYGRSCKDIGCPNNEVCVMEEDPCGIHSRNECGRFPTCKRVSNAVQTCATYFCPPSQLCRIDKGEPKCFDDPAATGNKENKKIVESYNPGAPLGENTNGGSPAQFPNQNYPPTPQSPYNPHYQQPQYPQNPPQYPQYPQYPQNPPQYPPTPNSRLYPNIPSGINGQTTARPNVYQPGQHVNSGGGYQGGAVGSGYPGQQGRYPQQSGYPQQGGYPQQNGGYPQQNGGYPQQGGAYPNQGYAGYPTQRGQTVRGNNNPGNYYGQQNKPSGQEGFLDKVTGTLKTIGLFWFFLKFVISRVNNVF